MAGNINKRRWTPERLAECNDEWTIKIEDNSSINEIAKKVLGSVYHGTGIALIEGLNLDEFEIETWLHRFGKKLGVLVPQTKSGNIISRIEDAGANINTPTHRGHKTAGALPFHADRTSSSYPEEHIET